MRLTTRVFQDSTFYIACVDVFDQVGGSQITRPGAGCLNEWALGEWSHPSTLAGFL
jgi:hypothetical protein